MKAGDRVKVIKPCHRKCKECPVGQVGTVLETRKGEIAVADFTPKYKVWCSGFTKECLENETKRPPRIYS